MNILNTLLLKSNRQIKTNFFNGGNFNFNYQDNGYHPLVCYDGITRIPYQVLL